MRHFVVTVEVIFEGRVIPRGGTADKHGVPIDRRAEEEQTTAGAIHEHENTGKTGATAPTFPPSAKAGARDTCSDDAGAETTLGVAPTPAFVSISRRRVTFAERAGER